MRAPYICVAGQDAVNGAWVRPVPDRGRLDTSNLIANRGVFDIGTIVEIPDPMPRPTRPEVEDYVCNVDRLRPVGWVEPDELWELLTAAAVPSLAQAFGPDLRGLGRTAAVPPGAGSASLGCVTPYAPPLLELTAEGKVRIDLTDSDLGRMSLPVTDLRLYESDLATPSAAAIEEARSEIRGGVPLLLCVGLTRPFGDDPQHWLQVNNLHFENELWTHSDGPGD